MSAIKLLGAGRLLYSATLMPFVRALSVMLMLAASLVAGDRGLARACLVPSSAMAEVRDCPCAQNERAHHAARPELERPSCCSIERAPSTPTPLATLSAAPDAGLWAPVLTQALPRLPLRTDGVATAFRDGPRSQGPPVFLKVRSLLI